MRPPRSPPPRVCRCTRCRSGRAAVAAAEVGGVLRPDRARFLELAREHDIVPVVRELTSDTVTPFTVWSGLAAAGRNPFLLESVEGGERVARFSFAGADPWRIVELRGGSVLVDGVPRGGSSPRGPAPGHPPGSGGSGRRPAAVLRRRHGLPGLRRGPAGREDPRQRSGRDRPARSLVRTLRRSGRARPCPPAAAAGGGGPDRRRSRARLELGDRAARPARRARWRATRR